MLLLVPSHKSDEGDTGKAPASKNRVLVLLPSDIDLSSNVVVPDTAITTTLGTNDVFDNLDSNMPYPIQRSELTNPKYIRDNLGILQPLVSTGQSNIHQSHLQQKLNSHRIYGQAEIINSNYESHPLEPTTFRNRRHSHTGLINEYSPSICSRARSASRQSISLISPYQHQQQHIRTPRALRSAFRKARKEQSPLLTSASFESDYSIPRLVSGLDSEDIPLSWKVAEDESTARFMHNSAKLISTDSSRSSLAISPSEKLDGSIVEGTDGDIEIESPPVDSTQVSPKLNTGSALTSNPNERSSEPLEILNADEPSDGDMKAESKPVISSHPLDKGKIDKIEVDNQDMELELVDTLDADMAMILGMTSDMELVIPKFDDEYLEDLKNNMAHVGQSRPSPVNSMVASPSCSDYSSTTITCRSTQHSPRSNSGTPRITSGELRSRAESLPVSPGVLAARARIQSCNETLSRSLSPKSSNILTDSPLQESAIVHNDIDNLKRHRDSLRQSADTIAHVQPSPSCSSPSNSTDEPKKPIYFKPSHHSIPNQVGSSNPPPQQNIMIIQSSSWNADNRVFPAQVSNILQSGNHIFRIQESSPRSQPVQLPQVPQPPQFPPPQSVQSNNIMMTANNISMVTANMSILTPQEAQDDYYARRNQRMLQLRQRRKSAMIDKSLPLRGSEGPMPWTRRNSTPNIHLSDKPTVPAIGACPLPASYFIPPSAFRTEAAVAEEKEAERKRNEQVEESYLVFPSPTLS